MIKTVISSATRVSLVPVRLAARLASSLVGELRGNGAADASRARPRETARAGTRAKASAKRSSTRSGSKPQPRRRATRTRAKTQPKQAPRRKPLDDMTIARKVESALLRDIHLDRGKVVVNVDDGVARLRGEVRTPELIDELVARANRVAEVRRVENLLHLPRTPAPGRTDTPAPPSEARGAAAPAGTPGQASGGESDAEAKPERSAREEPATVPVSGFPEEQSKHQPGDRSKDPSPHHALNNPVGEPDQTEWPDPYERREDPLDASDPDGRSPREAPHVPTGATSTSRPHPSQDVEAEPRDAPARDS